MAIVFKDNKYQANVYYKNELNQPKRKCSKWYKNKAEAVQAEKKIKNALNAPALSRTFETLALEYIEYTRPNNVEKTTADKLEMLYNYLTPLLALSIDQITPKTISAVFDQRCFKKLGVSRKNRVRGFASSVFRYGMRLYNLPANPIEPYPTFKDKEIKKPLNVYTPAEVQTVLSQIDEKHNEHRQALKMLFYTGTRLNECLSLTFSDLTENKIHIWRQYVKGHWQKLKTPGSDRFITLPAPALNVYKTQLEKYQSQPGFSPDWFIFGGERQLPANTLRRVYEKAESMAGLPKSRLHDLRHGHASILIKNMKKKEDLLKVSQRLGHSSITITLEVYAHLLSKEEDELIDILESLDVS